MDYHISGHNIELTEAIKEFIHTKSQKLNHHFSNIISLSVVISMEKEESVAEGTVVINDFEAHASANSSKNMYSAIDEMLTKLEKQLQKHKEKHKH